MEDEPLDERYLEWLYSQIGSVKLRTKSRTFWNLARQLYSKEFIWFIPNDDNRVEDGRELRQEFFDTQQIEDVDHDWRELGCSMLEMLVGLSRRLSFEAEVEGEPRVWFWRLLDNLALSDCNDKVQYSHKQVDEILDAVIWRTYTSSGRGGLFPLRKAKRDQRKVELWYQMSAYLQELY
jgi:hypothetical protein